MKFKEFLEAADIDTSNIKLDDYSNRYTFQFEGQEYTVKFYDSYGDYGLRTGGIYFEGPDGYSPTGISGPKASKLYGIMLSVVKAFVNKRNTQMLRFSGSTGSMDLVYKKFAEKYIGDEPGRPANEIFIQYTKENWIRKDAYENLPPMYKECVKSEMKNWNKEQEEYYSKIRQEGIERRNNYIKFKNSIGNFILVDDWRWCLVLQVSRDSVLTYVEMLPALSIKDLDTRWYNNRIEIVEAGQVPKDIIQQLASAFSKPENQDKLSPYPKEIIDKIIQLGAQ